MVEELELIVYQCRLQYFLTLSNGLIAGALRYIVSEANTNRALRSVLYKMNFVICRILTKLTNTNIHKFVGPC